MPRFNAKMKGPGAAKTTVKVDYKIARVALKFDASVKKYIGSDGSDNLKNLMKQLRKAKGWNVDFRITQTEETTAKGATKMVQTLETSSVTPPQINNVHEQGGDWKYQIDTATMGKHSTDRLWLTDLTAKVMSFEYDEDKKEFDVNVKINAGANAESDTH